MRSDTLIIITVVMQIQLPIVNHPAQDLSQLFLKILANQSHLKPAMCGLIEGLMEVYILKPIRTVKGLLETLSPWVGG